MQPSRRRLIALGAVLPALASFAPAAPAAPANTVAAAAAGGSPIFHFVLAVDLQRRAGRFVDLAVIAAGGRLAG